MGNIKIFKGNFSSSLPLINGGISTGFQSPADDYILEPRGFNRNYIRHPEASFYGDVDGDSMKDAGILDYFSRFSLGNVRQTNRRSREFSVTFVLENKVVRNQRDVNLSAGSLTIHKRENTLSLPIKQEYFDAIISGKKKEEYREIKDTTYKKDLQLLFEEDQVAWDNGVFPFKPIEYKFLPLDVGYQPEKDTAIVEVRNITFKLTQDD